MKHSAFVIVVSLAASLWGASGCVAPEVAEKASRPDVSQQEAEARLDTARKAFAAGDCQAALLICTELSYTKPGTPGLLPFRAQVLKTLRDQEALNVHASKAVDRRRMTMEALEATRLPGSYGRQGTTEALPEDRLSLESPMRKQLDMILNLHLRS